MTTTPHEGATRPATITDADMHAAVHDLGLLAHTMSKTLRAHGDALTRLSQGIERWRDRHGAAYGHVIDELDAAANDRDDVEQVEVHVAIDMREFNRDMAALGDQVAELIGGPKTRLTSTPFRDAMRDVERAMRSAARGPVTFTDGETRTPRAGSAEDPSCFTTRAATPPTADDIPGVRFVGGLPFTDEERAVFVPVLSFPGALPMTDDLADILTRLDEIGDDGVPCPETMHTDGPCRWCGNATGRVSIGTLTRYIAETGHVDRARAVLGLRPLAASR